MSYKNPLTYLIPLLFIILFALNLQIDPAGQQFVDLARSFLTGSLSFIHMGERIADYTLFDKKYYWPLGPFPAIFLIPFVLMFKTFYQNYISFPLNLINYYLLFQIARILGLNAKKSTLLTVFFIFGSIYFPVAALPASWYFAQTLACTLTILAIYEFLTKKRYLIIGILIAFAVATRFNLITSSIFFAYFLLKKPISFKNIAKFSLPILICLIILGTYNYKRFGNVLESGYKLQLIPKEPLMRREIGLFSPKHIPANIYYMVFKGPEPILRDESHELKFPFITFDSHGLSLFFLSPILFLIFCTNYKKELNKISAVTILFMLIPILTYYGIGQKQISFRYALDFFPFIYLILSDTTKKVSPKILYPLVFFGIFFAVYFSFLYALGLDKSV